MNCDPNSLTQAARCFQCLLPKTLIEVETYLLCQWSNHLTPACSAPMPVITGLQPVGSPPDGFDLVWTCARDPFVEFLIYFGQNQGGPYNDPQSPITIAPNLRSRSVLGLITGNVYYIVVVAVDSLNPDCIATSLESNIDLTA